MKFLNKKNTLSLFVGSLIVAASLTLAWICGAPNILNNTQCIHLLDSLVVSIFFYVATFLILAIFPFLLTLPLKPRVFEVWRSYAVWAVPIMLALSALIMIGGDGNAYVSFGVGPFLLMILYGAYLLISLIIIARAWWMSRNEHS